MTADGLLALAAAGEQVLDLLAALAPDDRGEYGQVDIVEFDSAYERLDAAIKALRVAGPPPRLIDQPALPGF